MMMGAGRDATALFNKFHAWVNIDFMMSKCMVGLLESPTDRAAKAEAESVAVSEAEQGPLKSAAVAVAANGSMSVPEVNTSSSASVTLAAEIGCTKVIETPGPGEGMNATLRCP